MDAKTFTASPQQTALIDWVRNGEGSCFLRARAGTGKTTTLIQASKFMTGSVAAAMFNKRNAQDFEGKLAEAGVVNKDYRAGTFHKFGYGAVRRVLPKSKLDAKGKGDRICREVTLDNVVGIPTEFQAFSLKLCSLAKQAALGLFGHVEDERRWWDIVEHHELDGDLEDPALVQRGIRYAMAALQRSNDLAPEVIDFDDMIYLPVVRNMKVWENDWVLVDEAQDTNPARRALARKMLRRGGRAIFVGDERQAIYGFTGADADAVELLVKEFSCSELPLTVTYRCPRAVVEAAQTYVKDIQAHETSPAGKVRTIRRETLEAEGLAPVDAILCRKTAPLVKLAFQLIKKGTACHVEGREIGTGLLNLAKRWKTNSITQLRDRLVAYREKEVEKLVAKGRETQAAAVEDRVECLLVLSEGCEDVDCVRQKIADMFRDDAPTLTLSTVHKAKGREWGRVFILGANAWMPSKWARQVWQKEQELNLIYVAITRSQRELVWVDVEPE